MTEEVTVSTASPDTASSTANPAATTTPAASAQTASAPSDATSVSAPVSEVAPSTADTAANKEAPVLAEETPALLTPEAPKEEAKVEPAEKTEAEKEVSQSDEPAPLPVYEGLELPNEIKADDERLVDFTKSLAEFEVATKASHEEVQKLGQSLINKYVSDMRTALVRQAESIVHQVNETKAKWVEEFKNDPELGGKRFNTSISEANEFVRTHGGTPEQINAFYSALKETGMEAHPAMVRFLLNVKNSQGFRAPQQLAATKPQAAPVSKIAKRYGSNN